MRLTSVVGVDVVGYSARTEVDSAVSAREIVALRERLADVAVRHNGRIFSTAGDGLMMEFAAAREAVAAIVQILRERPAEEPRLRIGAHLGDVTVTENGDLLGHGVNVAARLVAQAQPCTALLSEALHDAAGAQPRVTMIAKGEVALPKMATRIKVFEIESGEPQNTPRSPLPTPRNLLVAGALVLTLVLIAFIPSMRGMFPDLTPPATARPVSIAVLPFVNLSSDPEQEYFSDGLSEELMNQLGRIESLRVVGRASSFAFKGHNEDLRVIGQRLGVQHILEGSVRKSGRRLRITAQLVSVADGSAMWSESYDREVDDVFAIQEEIATALARTLSISLGLGAQGVDFGGTQSFEAYDQYLRGQRWLHQTDPALLAQYAGHLRRAVEIDPDYAAAWASLGALLSYWQNRITADEARRLNGERDQATRRALALAPELPASQFAEGWRQANNRNWTAANDAYARVVTLSRGTDRAIEGVSGGFLTVTGRARAGLPLRLAARDADPLSVEKSALLLSSYLTLRMWTEFDAEYERSRDLRRDDSVAEHYRLQRLVAARADARAVDEQFQRLAGSSQSGLVNDIVARRASPDEVRSILREWLRSDSREIWTVAQFAGMYGDVDLAIEAIRLAAQGPAVSRLQNVWSPALSETRRDPRFEQLMRDVGFEQFWRESGEWPDFCRARGANAIECW